MLEAPIYKSDNNESDEETKPSAYQSLMTGIAYMLPFTIAGGIFVALSFFFGTEANLEAGLVPVIEALQLGQFFGDIGGLLFSMMLPFLAGYIAFSIGNRAAIMPGVLAGIMAGSNGSGFLGAILGGFVAGYAARFLFDKMKNIPKSLQGSYQILFMPILLAIFIGSFMIIFGVPIAFINTSMQNMLVALQDFSSILLGAIIGAMMAADMGGPINKAAYVTGTLLLAEGNQAFMAAVMAGGMVPPLALAISTLVNKKLYSQEEIEMGKTNWVLGFSFITEGAIPFAAGDPKRVIPALMIGSAVADTLSIGETNIYNKSYDIFGGKAVNVASILSQFDCDYKLLTKSNNEFEDLITNHLEGIKYKLFNTANIRLNYKININNNITELNKQVNDDEYMSSIEIINYVSEVVNDDDYVLFAGSLSEKDIDLIINFRKSNPMVKIIIDSSSCNLEQIGTIKPFFYKPNLEEIAKIFSLDTITKEEIETYAYKLLDLGIEHLAVTLGSKGSIYLNKTDKKHVSIASGEVVNTVGAGDSFVGGFLIGSICNQSVDETLKLASACGCATSYTKNIAIRKDIDNLIGDIKIT